MRARPVLALITTVAMVPLAGPATARAEADHVTRCMAELKPKGRYTYAAGQSVPALKPLEGGTSAEADALNACIRAKAYGGQSAGAMQSPVQESAGAPAGAAASEKPRYTKRQRGASVLSGGAGYHGSYLEGGTGSRSSTPAQPVKTREARKAPRGLMNLPSGYPLMPGDEDLWYSLTLTQQQRALQFLQDGSTIRSSLEAD